MQLGVRKRFESRDFVAALERLARCNRGQTLEPEQLALAAAWILKSLIYSDLI